MLYFLVPDVEDSAESSLAVDDAGTRVDDTERTEERVGLVAKEAGTTVILILSTLFFISLASPFCNNAAPLVLLRADDAEIMLGLGVGRVIAAAGALILVCMRGR